MVFRDFFLPKYVFQAWIKVLDCEFLFLLFIVFSFLQNACMHNGFFQAGIKNLHQGNMEKCNVLFCVIFSEKTFYQFKSKKLCGNEIHHNFLGFSRFCPAHLVLVKIQFCLRSSTFQRLGPASNLFCQCAVFFVTVLLLHYSLCFSRISW